MSDPLDEYEQELRERSAGIPAKVEENLGIPFEQVQAVAAHLFSGLKSDEIIKTVRAYLLDSGLSMELLNASLEEMVTAARKYVKFVHPEHEDKRTIEDMRGSMTYLNYMYLGFLVTEYAEFLFNTEEQ